MTESTSTPTSTWWRDAVVYQLYVRSFSDHDGDGIGDLDGIADRIGYLASLGVDAIWINPCYPSPNRDGGYDIADYTTIDAAYGGLPAFEKLLAAAHERGLRVLMDIVPNHCSDQHPWFQEAVQAGPGSPQRGRFHFRDGAGPDGSLPPNNWLSTFGGSAWTRLATPEGMPEQWYLHSFDASQPDFNWANSDVAAMFENVLRLWFDRGVDGFRIDVAYALVKHPDLPDAPDPRANGYSWNQPGVHGVFERWRAIADSYGRSAPLVGEVWLPPEEAAAYIEPGRLSQVFYFDLMQQRWDAAALRRSVEATFGSLPTSGGMPAWTLNNHDVHRSVSRYGLIEPAPMYTDDTNALATRARGTVDVALGLRRARAATLLMLALPGAAYLYQGEELGLPEVMDLPDEARQDPIWTRSQGREHGRDGSRVPMPWIATDPSFGFSPPGSAPAWLPQPGWFADYAASAQELTDRSTLSLYRRAIAARRALFGGTGEDIEWLPTGRDDVLAFRRGGTTNVTVVGEVPYTPPAEWGAIAVRSGESPDSPLGPDESAWLRA